MTIDEDDRVRQLFHTICKSLPMEVDPDDCGLDDELAATFGWDSLQLLTAWVTVEELGAQPIEEDFFAPTTARRLCHALTRGRATAEL